ncbi:NADH dehydrogenase [ubiquinone] 1 beta subcomplex subunit 7-like [Anomalospiza imberbis]|uniref:NADH dehydrogenase [ubiquinone] 1 beta subcomplex subunit 7-like n=1 Tax=Anomalospiza imberbis TaxID=187417 RepID=UPI00358ED2F7
MGAHLGRRYLWDAEAEPDPLHMPSFPAELGMPLRQPRTMVASAAQLTQGRVSPVSLSVPDHGASAAQLAQGHVSLEQRDFCGHHLLRLLRCQRDNFPVPWGCHALRHAWDSCQHHE